MKLPPQFSLIFLGLVTAGIMGWRFHSRSVPPAHSTNKFLDNPALMKPHPIPPMKRKTPTEISAAFSRIADSPGAAFLKVSMIHQALDDRFEAQGISVGFDYDRPSELNHMSRPEWVIRTLNCFFCGCENSGNLSEYSEQGFRLIPEMEEVGLKGCANALRLIRLIEEEQERHLERHLNKEISEDEYDILYDQLEKKKPEAEQSSLAEGFDACGEALWAFALLHASEILPDP